MFSIYGRSSKKVRGILREGRAKLSDAREELFGVNIQLNNKILVGTHHKTGTVWMASIFRKLCRDLGLRFYSGEQDKLPGDFDVFLQNHSRFDLSVLQEGYKGVHVIRDPRDLIISGCFYHQKSAEPWLHVKKENLGGVTYQEKINSYNSLDHQIMFEMENLGLRSIEEMMSWNYANSAFIDVKYEDLVSDENLLLFHKVFTFLGLPGRCIPRALKIAHANSLFSGNLKNSVHIRSGQGRQWERYFRPAHKLRFRELFGDILIKLGYESNNEWADC